MDLCNINQIKDLLGRSGFRFSKSMGQNFLIAPWVPERIAEEAGLDENTGVIEIGPGIGCLTAQLSKSAGKVVAVELDNDLRPVLKETLSDCPNTEVVFGDILKMNLQELVSEKLSGLRPVVCANLPYNITSPVIAAILEARCFDTVTVMVQREVAQRMCAKAGAADYGAFTVFVNWYAQSELLFDVSPDCFMPQPKVTSSVIRLTNRGEKPVPVEDEELFFRVVRAAFNQRRKTLVNALSSGLGEYTKEKIGEIVISCGYNDRIRGETLDILGFARIANALSGLSKKQ